MGSVAPQYVRSSWIRDWTDVSWIARQIFNHWTTREAPVVTFFKVLLLQEVITKSRQNKTQEGKQNKTGSTREGSKITCNKKYIKGNPVLNQKAYSMYALRITTLSLGIKVSEVEGTGTVGPERSLHCIHNWGSEAVQEGEVPYSPFLPSWVQLTPWGLMSWTLPAAFPRSQLSLEGKLIKDKQEDWKEVLTTQLAWVPWVLEWYLACLGK